MNSLLAIDFGDYDTLAKLMKDPNLDYNTITRLDFSNNKYENTPPGRALRLLLNLRVILLSKNRIVRFDALKFIKGAPLLQEIDLSYNNIMVLDDIIELGSLQHLKTLDIRENPTVKQFVRVRLVEFLLFPAKYKPYNAVKILTATYDSVQDKSRLDPKAEEQSKKFYRLMERGDEELGDDAKRVSRINKYDHQNTPIKLNMQACPVPRKTRFPMLTMLNGQTISIQEVQSILMTDNLNEILYANGEEREVLEKGPRKNEKTHKKFIEKFLTRKEKIKDVEHGYRKPNEVIPIEKFDPMQHLLEKPTMERKKDHHEELWTKPVDVQYKDAEFTIGISDFKKSVKEYKEHKEKEKEKQEKLREERSKEIKMRSEEGKKKKKVKLDFKEVIENMDSIDADAIEDDIEIRRVFKKKVEKKKPKLKLEHNYNVEQPSSDTEVEEIHNEDEKEDWSESDFYFDEEEQELANLLGEGVGSPVNKSMSPKNMKKLVRQMTILKLGPVDEKKYEEEKSIKVKLPKGILKEHSQQDNPPSDSSPINEGFQIRLNLVDPKTKTTSIMSHLDRRFTTEIPRSNQRSMTPNVVRGRRFVVVSDSKPNLSVSAYGKSRDRSKEVPDQAQIQFGSQNTEAMQQKYFDTRKEKEPKVKENKEQVAGLNLLEVPSDDKSPGVILFSGHSPINMLTDDQLTDDQRKETQEILQDSLGTDENAQQEQLEELDKYKLDKFGASFDQDSIGPFQPEQNPQSNPNSALEKIPENSLRAQKKPQGNVIENAFRIAADLLLPVDHRASTPIVVTDNNSEAPMTLGKHIKVFSSSGSGSEANTKTRETANQSLGGADGRTTVDPSLPVLKEDYQPAEGKVLLRTLSRNGSIQTNKRDTTKLKLRKAVQQVWQKHRHSLSGSQSTKNFKITTAIETSGSIVPTQVMPQSTKSGSQFRSTDPFRIEENVATPMNAYYEYPQRTASIHSFNGFASMTTIQSPERMSPLRGVRFADESQHSNATPKVFTFEQNSISLDKQSHISSIMAHMSNKAKEVKNPQLAASSKSKRTRTDESHSIMIHNDLRPQTAMARNTEVEDLIPGPENGVPEAVKLRILNSRGPRYTKLLETAKMLDETDSLIRQSYELADRVVVNQLKRPKVDTVEKRIVGYDELTEYLRLFESGKILNYTDNRDIRELSELVNEHSKIQEEGMNKLDIEEKLRSLRKEAVGLEGDALEQKYMEIEKFDKYLAMMESLEAYRDNSRHTKKIAKLTDKEIKKAEHNAVLAMHYLKLKKYCDQRYLDKFMDDDLRLTNNNMTDEGLANGKSDVVRSKRPSIQVKLDLGASKLNQTEEPAETRPKSVDKTTRKQDSLLQYMKKVSSEKIKALKDYPYKREVPVYTDDKHRWLNITMVKKYEHKPMLKLEELMDQKRRRTVTEFQKKNPTALTAAEKAIKHAEEFKEGMKKTKVLKAKVDKYIKEGTRNLDDLLTSENHEIDRRFDQKKMFSEFMELLVENKL